MAVDAIVRRHGVPAVPQPLQGRDWPRATIAGERRLLLKPQTFMNASGESVLGGDELLQDRRRGDIVVIHDELDLRPGKVRVKRGGGAAGHNGLRSIDADDRRRITGASASASAIPGVKELVHPYVLQNFPPEEMRDWVEKLVDVVADTFPLLLDGAPQAFMSEVARRCPAPGPDDKVAPDNSAGDPIKRGGS